MLPFEWPTPPRVNILGVGISAIDMAEAVCCCLRVVHRRDKAYVCVTGVHGVMEAQRDPSYRAILNRSLLCTPDGMPTVWIGRLRGQSHMRRVYGPDLMLELCRASLHRGYRHFLYGGGPGTADLLKRRLEHLVPGIAVVGTYTPPFRPLSAPEQDDLVIRVAETRPDILWVGLSTPKQERFMAEMKDRLGAPLMIGVGAAFDIHAGLLPDAPAWMKQAGLQWLYRLLREPRRLWKRYLTNNPAFVWNVFLQFLSLRRFEMDSALLERR